MRYEDLSEPKKLLTVFWQFIRQNDFHSAARACSELNNKYAGNVEGWYATSYLRLLMNDSKQALSAINEAIALKPANVSLALHKVRCLNAAGKAGESAQLALQLAEFDIDDATLCDELALLLCDSQHFLKAKQLGYQSEP